MNNPNHFFYHKSRGSLASVIEAVSPTPYISYFVSPLLYHGFRSRHCLIAFQSLIMWVDCISRCSFAQGPIPVLHYTSKWFPVLSTISIWQSAWHTYATSCLSCFLMGHVHIKSAIEHLHSSMKVFNVL